METAAALSPIFFPEDSTKNCFELAGILARLAFCGLPAATDRNSGRDYKKFSQRHTAAGTAPVFHRIPSSNKRSINGGLSTNTMQKYRNK